MNKQKYENKIAKIEEIKRRKSQEIVERKNKSKSPTTIISTMSEIECIPYRVCKATLERTSGYNTMPAVSLVNSTSARTPQ